MYQQPIDMQGKFRSRSLAINLFRNNKQAKMVQVRKLACYKSEKQYLEQSGLLIPKLQPDIIKTFIDYQIELTLRIKRGIINLNIDALSHRIQVAMDVLATRHHEVNITYVVKKCLLLHTFLHQSSLLGVLTPPDSQLLGNFINKVVHEDVPKLTKPEKKREGSLQKIYHYVRSISTPKDQSKLKLQGTSEKGAVKELVTKVVAPLGAYLLKINEDRIAYSKVLTKNITQEEWQSVKWKVLNYIGVLSNIILELNRLCKYYKDDLLGCWLLLYFIMSTDITIYYDLLIGHLVVQAEQWREKIMMMSKICKISRKHNSQMLEIASNQGFRDMVRDIEVVLEFKEKLLYLYFNIQMKKWIHLFKRPQSITGKSKSAECLQFIIEFSSKYNSPKKEKIQTQGYLCVTQENIADNSNITQIHSQRLSASMLDDSPRSKLTRRQELVRHFKIKDKAVGCETIQQQTPKQQTAKESPRKYQTRRSPSNKVQDLRELKVKEQIATRQTNRPQTGYQQRGRPESMINQKIKQMISLEQTGRQEKKSPFKQLKGPAPGRQNAFFSQLKSRTMGK